MFLWLVLACGCGGIRDGEVIDKRYSPASSSVILTMNPVTQQLETQTVDYPEAWFVTVRKTCEDGKVRTREFRVSPATWNGLRLGDWFSFGGS